MAHNLDHIDAFIFDLDDTLYPHGAFLTMDNFLSMLNEYAAEVNSLPLEKAQAVTESFLKNQQAGVSNEGDIIVKWQHEYNFNLQDFTNRLDNLDASHMQPCQRTLELLDAMPVRKVIFTNAHKSHAERMLEILEMSHHFEHICDYVSRGQRMKPNPDIYQELVERLDLDASKCVMVEDRPENLRPAKQLGMSTVLVHPHDHIGADADYVDMRHKDVIEWLENVRIRPSL